MIDREMIDIHTHAHTLLQYNSTIARYFGGKLGKMHTGSHFISSYNYI